MKQIKPKVIGYKQIEYEGSRIGSIPLTKVGMVEEAKDDWEEQFLEGVKWPIKSKFRPVYGK